MTEQSYQGLVSEIDGKVLDYWMYVHAAKQLGREASKADFEQGYAEGRFHFSVDKPLLVDLMERNDIRLQMLGREWLASTEDHAQYGAHPLVAVCRLVVSQAFGTELT